MHTVAEAETSVPAFLGKLWKLVDDPQSDDLICWSPTGRSFFIRNPAQFARELLPHYYKHNNMASFVRQLNMYGFHKKVSVELGGLKCDRDEMEFAHQYFIKEHPYLLEHIKRKIASKPHDPEMKPEIMNRVLLEVRTMRGRQEHLDTRLGAMKRENEALWRELAMLRRKHLKQQEIVNKLIHFLVTLVQPQRGGGGLPVKRRYPLMIHDRQRHKHAKMSKPAASPTGPVIHELEEEPEDDAELASQYIVADMLESQMPAVQSPASDSALDNEDTETIYHIADETVDREIEMLKAQEAAVKKRSAIKSKKRKSTVPVKILVPSTQVGEKPREETLLVELNSDEMALPIALLENEVKQKSKAIPKKAMRSSKLRAMAANIDKLNAGENLDKVEQSESQSPVDLADILIVPEVMTPKEAKTSKKSHGDDWVNEQLDQAIGESKAGENSGATKSKDLSLSCVTPSGSSDNYRLGSKKEMDSHLETMQTELDNLRDVLRGEGYSIDANTLLGLFGGDDPMSFGIPMNPELNPIQRDKNEDDYMCDTNNEANGGELMAYNPPDNLLDFDDDILMAASSPSMNILSNQTSQNIYSPDPLGLEDSKAALLETLMAETAGSTSKNA